MAQLSFDETQSGFTYVGSATCLRREDIETFGRITRDMAPIHHDDEYARKTVFGSVVAHGLFGLSLMAGLKSELHLHGPNAIASLGWNNVRFLKPIYPGSSVHVRATVTDKRPSRKPAQGVVSYHVELLDEQDVCLVEGDHIMLIARHGGDAGGAPTDPSLNARTTSKDGKRQ